MAWFKCFIHGQNFPGRLLGRKRSVVGFYTTRVVQASSADAAEMKAVALLRVDPSLKLARIFRTGEAKAYFESVEEIPAHHRLVRRRPKGFTFYVEHT